MVSPITLIADALDDLGNGFVGAFNSLKDKFVEFKNALSPTIQDNYFFSFFNDLKSSLDDKISVSKYTDVINSWKNIVPAMPEFVGGGD